MQPQQGPGQQPSGAAGGALQAAVAAAAAAASLRLPLVQALGRPQLAGGQGPAPAPASLTQLGAPVLLPPSLPAGVGAAAPGGMPPLAPVQPAGTSTLALAASQQAWQAPPGLMLQGSMMPVGTAGQVQMKASAAEVSSAPAAAAAASAAAAAGGEASGASSNSSNSSSNSGSSRRGADLPPEAAAVAEQLRQAGATLLFAKVRFARMLLGWVGSCRGGTGRAGRFGVGCRPGKVPWKQRRLHGHLSQQGGAGCSENDAAPLAPNTSLPLPLPLPQVLTAFDVKNGRVPGSRVIIPKVRSRLSNWQGLRLHTVRSHPRLQHPESNN
jgi:hypothetical protein